MKKVLAFLLAVMLLCAFAGCEKAPQMQKDPTQPSIPQETPNQDPEDMPVVTDNPALSIMLNIWEQFKGNKEDYIGGCNTEYQMATPWQVDLSEEDFLQGTLLIPEEELGRITAAASLMHSLNTNHLTVGAVVLEEGTDYEAFAAKVKEKILQNQWVCGRPGGMRLVKVENCLLIIYGSGTYSGGFVSALNEVYPEAETVYQEAI